MIRYAFQSDVVLMQSLSRIPGLRDLRYEERLEECGLITRNAKIKGDQT